MRRRATWAGLLAASALLAACGTGFDPRVPAPVPFAVYGRLDGAAPRQLLRVESLEAPLDDTGPLGATVTSETVETGETAVWADSVVSLADGRPGRVATAALAVRPGQTLRLRVTRAADGAETRATVRIDGPTAATAAVSAPPDARQEVDVRGLSRAPERLELRYRVRRTDTGAEADVAVPYTPTLRPGGASVLVDLTTDARRIRAVLGVPESAAGVAAVVRAELAFVARAAAPVPVENGIGAVDWTVPVALSVRADAALLARVGLADAQAP